MDTSNGLQILDEIKTLYCGIIARIQHETKMKQFLDYDVFQQRKKIGLQARKNFLMRQIAVEIREQTAMYSGENIRLFDELADPQRQCQLLKQCHNEQMPSRIEVVVPSLANIEECLEKMDDPAILLDFAKKVKSYKQKQTQHQENIIKLASKLSNIENRTSQLLMRVKNHRR